MLSVVACTKLCQGFLGRVWGEKVFWDTAADPVEGVPMGQRSGQPRVVHSMPKAPGKRGCLSEGVLCTAETLGFLTINPLCTERS